MKVWKMNNEYNPQVRITLPSIRLIALAILLTVVGVILPAPLSVVCFGVVVFTIVVISSLELKTPLLLTIFSFSFLTYVVYVDSVVPFLPYFPDAAQYHRLAEETAFFIRTGKSPPTNIYPNLKVASYSYTMGVLYSLYGSSIYIPTILNAGAWSIMISHVHRLSNIISGRSSAPTLIILAFSPAAILYVPAVLRDTLALLLFATACYHFYLFLSEDRLERLIIVLLPLSILVFYRSELIPVFVISGAITTVLRFRRNIALLLASVISSTMLFLVLLNPRLFNLPGYLNPFRLELLEGKRAAEASRPNAYLTEYAYNSWIDVVIQIPVRFVYLLFSPFPWNPGNYHMFLATIDGFFVLVLILPAVYGMLVTLRMNLGCGVLFLMMTAILLLVGYSIVISTQGVASRRRFFAIPILVLFTSIAVEDFIYRVDQM